MMDADRLGSIGDYIHLQNNVNYAFAYSAVGISSSYLTADILLIPAPSPREFRYLFTCQEYLCGHVRYVPLSSLFPTIYPQFPG
jgi:hypothetical protein